MGDIQMPDTFEICGVLRVAAGRRAQEGQGRAIAVAGHHGGEGNVLDSQRRSHVADIGPGSAMIVRDGDHGMSIAAVPAKIHGIVRSYPDGWIAITRGAAGHSVDGPGGSVIAGRDRRHVTVATVLVGNIGGAVRADFDMSMQAAAIEQAIDRDCGTVAEAAVQADGTRGIDYILRAVIDGVLIAHGRRQLWNQAGSKGAAADRLMVNARGYAAAGGGGIACAVIVSECRQAARSRELRDKGPAGG